MDRNKKPVLQVSIAIRSKEERYWQYFCGEDNFTHEFPCDPTSLVKWRQRVGVEGSEQLLKESLAAAQREAVLTAAEVNGKAELAADRLADPLAIQGPGDWIHDAVCDGPVELVAPVEWRHIVEMALQDRAEKELKPFGSDRAEVRVNHGASSHLQTIRDLEDSAKGAPFPGDAVVRGHDPGDRGRGLRDEDRSQIRQLCLSHDLLSPIRGAAVRVDNDRLRAGEVLGQSRRRCADHVADSPGVVVARDPHEQVGTVDLAKLDLDGLRERRRLAHATLKAVPRPVMMAWIAAAQPAGPGAGATRQGRPINAVSTRNRSRGITTGISTRSSIERSFAPSPSPTVMRSGELDRYRRVRRTTASPLVFLPVR